MNLRKMLSRHSSLVGFICLFILRSSWEFRLSHDLRLFLLECSAIPISLLLFVLLFEWVFKKIDRNTNFLIAIVLISISSAAIYWAGHSIVLTIILAVLGVSFGTVFVKKLVAPESEEQRLARRAAPKTLLADRDAFERSWQRKIKITEGFLILLCASLTAFCWSKSVRSLAIVPALLGLFFLIGIFGTLIPMSDEKFEERLAKAKARQQRAEARHARFANRKREREQQLEERKKRPKPNSQAEENFSTFVSLSVIIGIFWFQGRSHLGRPDLVFLALPTWYLIRSIYFFIRQAKHPKGPDGPVAASEPAISDLGA